MKHCDKCNVNVNSTLDYCPLCFNKIDGEHTEPSQYSVTKNKPKEIIKSHTTRKIFFLISLAVISVCGVINYLTNTPFWSGIVGLSIVYLWVFVKHTIMSDRSVFEKVLLQIVSMVALLMLTNDVSGGGWFWEYVLPALLSFVVITLNMIMFISKKRKNYEISFVIIDAIILIFSIVCLCIEVYQFKTLHIITTLVSAFSIVGIVVMDGKNLFQEISKKFHL